jgi:hypothetical protein
MFLSLKKDYNNEIEKMQINNVQEQLKMLKNKV